ncbi:hypothetical protein ABZ671_11975 [Micromonospora sp. NPDC006766]|uniref:hypothetical protein n=1 Tax=Micromonospora sp. NPDC006766 TaxID=3154778 RepID=UPI0033F85095
MDFWDLTKLMFRRWYISMSLLLVTLAATGYTAVVVKPDYAITAYVQLIPPTAASDPNQASHIQNPWLALGMTSLSNAAMVATQDQTFLDGLKQQDDTASFEITIGDRNPVAIIAVVAPTLQQAQSATALVTGHYEESVKSLQAQYGVKATDMITAYRLDKGENLQRPGGKVKRAVIAVFAIGLLMTGGLTVLIDALLRRRRRRGTPTAPVGPDFTVPPSRASNGTQTAVRHPVTRTDRDPRPPAASRIPDDATIILPRTPRAGEGRTDMRGRRF